MNRLLRTVQPHDNPEPEDRLAGLGQSFDLEPVDLAVLLVALAPDADARFEQLYAYLHDDVSRRRPTIGLCLELCGVPVVSHEGRSRFRPDAPLTRHRLVTVEDPTAPYPSRVLRVPDRVVDHLLGSDIPDQVVAPLLLPPLAVPSPRAGMVEAALSAGVRLFYVRGPRGATDHAEAAGALVEVGLPCLTVDLSRVDPHADAQEVAAAVAREAGLRTTGLVAGPIDDLVDRDRRAVEALAEAPGPTLLLGARAWEPAWTPAVPVILDVGAVEPSEAEHV
ncbi:MAG: ATP-binding protein, partial [Acidimicrobiales bacterium]